MFVISLVNFYLFLSQHYIVYCENVLTQVNGQIENVLHKNDSVTERGVFLTICDSPLYKSDYYDESVMFSGRKIVTSLANISYNNDDIDNIFCPHVSERRLLQYGKIFLQPEGYSGKNYSKIRERLVMKTNYDLNPESRRN